MQLLFITVKWEITLQITGEIINSMQLTKGGNSFSIQLPVSQLGPVKNLSHIHFPSSASYFPFLEQSRAHKCVTFSLSGVRQSGPLKPLKQTHFPRWQTPLPEQFGRRQSTVEWRKKRKLRLNQQHIEPFTYMPCLICAHLINTVLRCRFYFQHILSKIKSLYTWLLALTYMPKFHA